VRLKPYISSAAKAVGGSMGESWGSQLFCWLSTVLLVLLLLRMDSQRIAAAVRRASRHGAIAACYFCGCCHGGNARHSCRACLLVLLLPLLLLLLLLLLLPLKPHFELLLRPGTLQLHCGCWYLMLK
jgi:hypothetical protein